MDHAIRADQRLLPGFSAEETRILDQGDGLDDELIETIHGDLDIVIVVLCHPDHLICDAQVTSQGGQEVAHAAFSRVDTVLKAKAEGIVGVAWVK